MGADRSSGIRIPSLDGMRAVAIGLVLLAHLGGTRGFPLSAAQAEIVGTGALGVRVFFVLSGFLITGLLLTEMERTGTIRIGTFYLRRVLRICPAYYGYLACVALLGACGMVTLRSGDLLHALTYTANYHPDHAWIVGHAWSLAVEEQFYLLWPITLVALGRSRGLHVALAVLCVVPAVRLAEWYGTPAAHVGVGYTFETVADALAAGGLLAGMRERLWATAWYRRILTPAGIAIVAVGILVIAAQDRPRMQALVGAPLVNLGIAAMIDYFVRTPAGAVGRVLNRAPLRRVGVLSYSLYLWQQPFLDARSEAWWTTFPVSLVLVACCALASYRLVEVPALALRRRLERRQRVTPSAAPAPV